MAAAGSKGAVRFEALRPLGLPSGFGGMAGGREGGGSLWMIFEISKHRLQLYERRVLTAGLRVECWAKSRRHEKARRGEERGLAR